MHVTLCLFGSDVPTYLGLLMCVSVLLARHPAAKSRVASGVGVPADREVHFELLDTEDMG